jgi:AcrR family transcriptional regulator
VACRPGLELDGIVVGAAVGLLATEGYRGLTVKRVGDLTGVSRGM